MSIINDALKKAAKDQPSPRHEDGLILSEIDKARRYAESHASRRKFFFTATVIAAFLGFIFVLSLRQRETGRDSESALTKDTFYQRQVDVQFPTKTAQLHLSGILYDEQRPLAIINNRIVEEGSVVGETQVLEIQPNLVKLSSQGKEFTLKVK